jgi:alanine dehydrogenase
MIVGIPKEIKNNEYRVSVVPSGVRALVESGHKVIVQESAGEGSGISDADYIAAGAVIKSTPDDIYQLAGLVVKVKEPQPQEYPLLREGQILFAYLHLASSSSLTGTLLGRKIVGIAYETVQMDNGYLPLLTPSSEIAGKVSIQVGAHYLEKENGGSGILLGGVPGVKPASVTVIGAGTVGTNAAKIALGMGSNVTVLDISLDRLGYLSEILEGRLTLLVSNPTNIETAVIDADLVIGGVLVPGAKAKKLVARQTISRMRKGSVMVDVAIDQGGCFETSVPTTFDNPIFLVDGIIQYCVANMPSCVSRTASFALTNATSPYVLKLANLGGEKALEQDLYLRKGLNVYRGYLTHKAVADAVGVQYTPVENVL